MKILKRKCKTSKKRSSHIKCALTVSLIIVVLFSVGFLIYLVPTDENNRLTEIILSITSATISGFLTLAGVAWTIRDNSNKLREERKLSIKPYLDIRHEHFETIEELPRKDALFVEIDDYLSWGNTLPEEIERLLTYPKDDNNGLELAAKNMLLTCFSRSHYLMSCEIENCGAGNAIDLKIKLNDFELSPFCVTTAAPKRVVLVISDKLISKENGERSLVSITYTYTDVSKIGKYEQKESFIFIKNDKEELQLIQFKENLLTPQEEF